MLRVHIFGIMIPKIQNKFNTHISVFVTFLVQKQQEILYKIKNPPVGGFLSDILFKPCFHFQAALFRHRKGSLPFHLAFFIAK